MTHPQTNVRIDADRLWSALMDMAKIGPGARGANNRQTVADTHRNLA